MADLKSRLTVHDDWVGPSIRRRPLSEISIDVPHGQKTTFGASVDEDLILPQLFSVVKRQWLLMLNVFGSCIILSLWLYLETPEKFRASAVVLVDDQLSQLASSIEASQTFVQDEIGFFNEIEVFNSRELALRVVRTLGLVSDPIFNTPPPTFKQRIRTALNRLTALGIEGHETTEGDLEVDAADFLRESLRVMQKGRGHSIDLSYESHDADLATTILQTYLDEYKATPMRANDAANRDVLTWLERRHSLLDGAMLEIESEIAALRLDGGADPAEEAALLRRLSSIEKIRTTSSETYENLLSSQQTAPIVGVKVLDAPVVPKSPVTPILFKFIALGALVGMILAVCGAATREVFDTKLRIAAQLTDVLDLPFLGYLPRFSQASPTDGALQSTYLKKRRGLARVFEQTVEETLALIDARRESNLRGNVIALTSMLQNDDRHVVTLNLAVSAAERGLNVLVVDADRYCADLSFLVTTHMDNSTYVHDGEMVLKQGTLKSVDGRLISVLVQDVTKRKFLPSAARCDDVINYADKIAHLYDLVLIDLPAFVVSNDASKIADSLTTVLFVAAWGHTPRKLIKSYFARNPDFMTALHGLIICKTNIQKLKTYSFGGYEAFMAQR